MRRLRAFVLTELLTTMLLQGMFIVVLCTSFYMLTSFYTKTQQILTARGHAERVIAFFDDKIRHAGLGLWQCKNPTEIRRRMKTIIPDRGVLVSKRLPAHLNNIDTTNHESWGQELILLYAQRDISSGAQEAILFTNSSNERQELTLQSNTGDTRTYRVTVNNLDTTQTNWQKVSDSDFNTANPYNNDINCYAVAEGVGFPFHVQPTRESSIITTFIQHNDVSAYTIPFHSIPPATELMYLKCINILVQNTSEGRSLAFKELTRDASGPKWGNTYNQEKGILEIYMELDTDTNIFTLYVLASGGTDYTIDTPRPSVSEWPSRARPIQGSGQTLQQAWESSGYNHHIIYVSRASWKLNNIPENFTWY